MRGRLAAQADQQVAADVRMPGDAGQHAVELLMVLAAVLHAAAPLVHQRQDAVDVGKLRPAAPRSNRWAMYLLTEAEQFTVEMMAR